MRHKESSKREDQDPYRLSYISDEDQTKENIEILKENQRNLREGMSGVDKMLKYSLISNVCFFIITVLVIIFAPYATASRYPGHGAPIGTISAWTMKVTVSGVEVGDIPDGWQRCDGSVILEPSIWAGERTPDLNNERRFLRGGSDTSVLSRKQNNMIYLTDDLIAISFQWRMTSFRTTPTV